MIDTDQPPWTSGPLEILNHGLDLVAHDTDTNRRLAMIAIDNAVELMIKTYLGLPRRITGLALSRKEYESHALSFPGLLDCLERHGSDKIVDIDLGEVEWYHRLRNQLYHHGNGLTVEREKLVVYARLARKLFENLFGLRPSIPDPTESEPLSEFLSAWARIESAVLTLADKRGLTVYVDGRPSHVGTMSLLTSLDHTGAIPSELVSELQRLREMRNRAVHSPIGSQESVSASDVKRTVQIARTLDQLVGNR